MAIPANRTITDLLSVVTGQIDRIKSASTANTPAAQARLEAAVAEQNKLEELASPRAQRELYQQQTGAAWEDRFWRVRELRYMEAFGLRNNDLVEYLWREFPNSRIKRFQELFTDPDSYSVPKMPTSAPCAQFPQRADLNTCSLRSCLVSPDRIPNKLAQDLGLITWPDKAPSPINALEMKAQPSVIQGLKAIWETVFQLEPRNHRILVVGCGSPDAATNYPEAPPLDPSRVGSIIYVREDSSVDRSPRRNTFAPWAAPRRIAAFFPTVYAAYRKTLHETSGYDGEMTALNELRAKWDSLNERVNAQWKRRTAQEVKDALREELVTLVAESRKEFESVSNHHKKQAETFFAALSDDLAQGSNNIRALTMRTTAAVTRLDRRQREVPYKSGTNESDRVELKRIIEQMEERFKLVNDSLLRASTILKQEITNRGGYFRTAGLSDEAKLRATDRILGVMRIPVEGMAAISIRPFRVFGQKISESHIALRDALLRQDAVAAQQAIVQLVALSKLQRASATFERIRRYTGSSTAVPLRDLTRIAAQLRSVLELRSVFSDHIAASYDPTYQQIQRAVRRMANQLEAYEKKGMDLSQRTLMYKKLRAFLDLHDIEGLTSQLPS
jgi:hypothetical protein